MIDMMSCATSMSDLAYICPPTQSNSDKDWVDYINIAAVLVATISAFVSASCASRANKNVHIQQRSQRYDALYGDALHKSVEDAYLRIDHIKRSLIDQTLPTTTVTNIVQHADVISSSQLGRHCDRIDNAFDLNQKMAGLYEELDNALSSVKSFVTGNATDKVQRANHFIVEAEKATYRIELENLNQRDSFSTIKPDSIFKKMLRK